MAHLEPLQCDTETFGLNILSYPLPQTMGRISGGQDGISTWHKSTTLHHANSSYDLTVYEQQKAMASTSAEKKHQPWLTGLQWALVEIRYPTVVVTDNLDIRQYPRTIERVAEALATDITMFREHAGLIETVTTFGRCLCHFPLFLSHQVDRTAKTSSLCLFVSLMNRFDTMPTIDTPTASSLAPYHNPSTASSSVPASEASPLEKDGRLLPNVGLVSTEHQLRRMIAEDKNRGKP